VSVNLKPGDKIEFLWKGIKMSGRYISSDQKVTVVKLSNGYNLSLNNSNLTMIRSEKSDYSGNYREKKNDPNVKEEGQIREGH
jgi:hypothetical protein